MGAHGNAGRATRARISRCMLSRCDHVNHPKNDKLSIEGAATMELTTTTQVSVDGVMQGPGGPDEDERGVFERGGWAHFDNEAGTVMDEIFQRADAFLFGRRTYEIFASSWGTWDDPGDSPIWTALDKQPKYVASTTLTEPRWANTTVLSGDVEAAVRELKAKPGGGLQAAEGGPRVDCKPGSVGVSSFLACEYETTSNDTARSTATVP